MLPEQAVNDAGDGTDRLSLLIGPPALGALMLVLSQGGRWGWGSRATLAVGLGATLTLVGFVRRSHRVATPLLDVALFSNREFSVNVVAGSLQQAGFFAWFLTAPLIMNEVWGWSPRNAGFALALSQILASVGSPTGGWVVGRAGPYTVIVLGALINVAGALWLVVMAGPEPDFWVGYVPAALMLGFGASWCGTATSGGGLAALSAGQLGLGNSVQQLVRRVGGSVGVAIAIALLGDAKGDALLVGAKRVWWMAVFVHVAMLVPLLLIDRPFARSRAVRPSS